MLFWRAFEVQWVHKSTLKCVKTVTAVQGDAACLLVKQGAQHRFNHLLTSSASVSGALCSWSCDLFHSYVQGPTFREQCSLCSSKAASRVTRSSPFPICFFVFAVLCYCCSNRGHMWWQWQTCKNLLNIKSRQQRKMLPCWAKSWSRLWEGRDFLCRGW